MIAAAVAAVVLAAFGYAAAAKACGLDPLVANW